MSVFLSYPGGKARMARKIVERMQPHQVYVEPFCGTAFRAVANHNGNSGADVQRVEVLWSNRPLDREGSLFDPAEQPRDSDYLPTLTAGEQPTRAEVNGIWRAA